MYVRQYFRHKFLFILFAILFLGFAGGVFFVELDDIVKVDVAQATLFNPENGTGDSVRGFAWSPNFGWISFNSSDCDLDGNGSFGDDGAPAGCPSASVEFHDYGVNIETGTGIFDGFAWSANLGWIYFGPDANLGIYGNALQADAPEVPFQWATYNYDDNSVVGWAKALSLGDNGWIKFDGIWQSVSIDFASGNFSGYAWNGNDSGESIGWISFNCEDMANTCSGGSNPGVPCPNGNECIGGTCRSTCDLSSYAVNGVVNRPPDATELEAPYLTNQELCEMGARNAILKWEFHDTDYGAYETAYQVIFDDDDDPDNPIFESPKCDLNSNHVDCLVSPGVDQYPIHDVADLDYGGHYYWWVKVWDDYDVESDWISSTDWGADFVVPGHELPQASVDDYRPTMPSAGEEIYFTGSSAVYKYSSPGLSVPCTNDEINCWWYWSIIPSYYASINDPATTSPVIIMDNSEQQFFVTLSVTDQDGFSCTSSPIIFNPNIDLPTWIEVKNK